MMGIKEDKLLWFINFFDSKVVSPDKKSVGSGAKLIPQNEQLADELHKPIIR